MRQLPEDSRLQIHFQNCFENAQDLTAFQQTPVMNFAQFTEVIQNLRQSQNEPIVPRIGTKMAPVLVPIFDTPELHSLFRKRMEFVVIGGIEQGNNPPQEIGIIDDDALLTEGERNVIRQISKGVSRRRRSLDTLFANFNTPSKVLYRSLEYRKGEEADDNIRQRFLQNEAQLGVAPLSVRACVFTALVEQNNRTSMIRKFIKFHEEQMRLMQLWMREVRSVIRSEPAT